TPESAGTITRQGGRDKGSVTDDQLAGASPRRLRATEGPGSAPAAVGAHLTDILNAARGGAAVRRAAVGRLDAVAVHTPSAGWIADLSRAAHARHVDAAVGVVIGIVRHADCDQARIGRSRAAVVDRKMIAQTAGIADVLRAWNAVY